MRRCLFALGILAVGACSNDKIHEHHDGSIGPAYWQPEPGEAKNWDIQVNAPFDASTERAMMIVDLWASVPAATMIDYGDGDPVVVPEGANKSTIGTLQARQTKIICRVGLGGLSSADPDYRKFPAAAIGDVPTAADPDERYLDLAQRDTWEDVAFARLDLAKQIGCDGIEPYLADHDLNTTGFPATSEEEIAWGKRVALEVHARELSAGMRNGTGVPGLVDALQPDADWLLVERCAEFHECDSVRSYLNARKAVFAVDYNTEIEKGDPQDPAGLCAEQSMFSIKDGLVKDVALSNTFRLQCE